VTLTGVGLASIGSLNVPAGNYVVAAETWATNNSTTNAVLIDCRLVTGGDFDETRAQLEEAGVVPGAAALHALAFNVVHTFATAGTIDLQCNAFGVSVSFADMKITATQVGSLTNGALGP
jgi:hypothetical protein